MQVSIDQNNANYPPQHAQPLPQQYWMQTKPKKSFFRCTKMRCIIAAIVICLSIAVIVVFAVLAAQLRPEGNYPLNMDDWNMETAAFAGGFEALIFTGTNKKNNQVGAIKVFVEQARDIKFQPNFTRFHVKHRVTP